jgi:hypothetical protein
MIFDHRPSVIAFDNADALMGWRTLNSNRDNPMRRSLFSLGTILSVCVSTSLADDKPQAAPTRLQAFVIPGSKAKPADSDAPLAEGWPQGTEPGIIEVKNYPGYRSAVARAKEGGLAADNFLFFPLFNHITKSEIAMTTPVVMNYAPEVVKDSKARGEISMEFVYRSPTMGQTGQGVGAVKVEDHPASAYVCLGVQGDLDGDRMRLGVEALQKWLAAHKEEWVETGPGRRIGYHGPMTKRNERLWEVQIPVQPAPKPTPEKKP